MKYSDFDNEEMILYQRIFGVSCIITRKRETYEIRIYER